MTDSEAHGSRISAALAFWSHYVAAPPGDGETALAEVIRLFSDIPDDAPEPVRDYLLGQQDADSPSAAIATNLAILKMREHQISGADQALREAVAAFAKAAGVTGVEHRNRATYLSNYASALGALFRRTGAIADIDAGIDVAKCAVDAVPDGHVDRPMYLSNLGAALQLRFSNFGDVSDLDAAVDAIQEAVAAPADAISHAQYLSNLAVVLNLRAQRRGTGADLETAVDALRRALTLLPPDHPDWAFHATNLGIALTDRFKVSHNPADLDEAVAKLTDAIDATPARHPLRVRRLAALASTLRARFDYAEDSRDLDEAIDAQRAAVMATPDDHPDLARHLSALGVSLRTRAERTGNADDVDEAISAGTRAIDLTPEDRPGRAYLCTNLGNAYLLRFDRTGDRAALDTAVALGRQAVATIPEDHPDLAGLRSNLADRLLIRYWRDGAVDDLDKAIAVLRAMSAALPDGHLDSIAPLTNLANAMVYRAGRTGNHADLTDAIALGRQVLDILPADHPRCSQIISNLAVALGRRFAHSQDTADLHEAVNLARRAVDKVSPEHPAFIGCLANLASALTDRFDKGDDPADLDEAIIVGRRAAAATPVNHPGDARVVATLGNALVLRYQLSGNEDDLEEALTCRRQVAGSASAPSLLRLLAAQAWGGLAHVVGREVEAADGYAAAVRLLPELAWHGLDRATREGHLARQRGLATDAGAIAVKAGRVETAVEVLEQGRSVLWNQVLRLRSDLDTLAIRRPDLATEMNSVRKALDAPLRTPSTDVLDFGAQGTRHAEERRHLARRWDELLAEVRTMPSFENFLAPTPFATLATAATDGPVVVVNASVLDCHALILTAGLNPAVQVVHLPDLTRSAVVSEVTRYRSVMTRLSTPGYAHRHQDEDNHTLSEVLDWLWTAVTQPILDSLTASGCLSSVSGSCPSTRLWWCATGPLAQLPLHAAGKGGDARSTVAAHVVSSYTPTISALVRARRPRTTERVRSLAVGVPDAPGLPRLPGVAPELAELARHTARAERTRQLTGPDATHRAVLAALADFDWVHFACHGFQRPGDPSTSAFALADRALTVVDLAGLDLDHADLAFLSACQTATGDTRLLDEAVHLAAAMQLVGFRHVIATLWPVSDVAARRVARSVYAELTDTGTPSSAQAAVALHHAVTELRFRFPEHPLMWAPFVHFGA